MYNFSEVEQPTNEVSAENRILRPGQYAVKVDPESVTVVSEPGKNPYLRLTLVSDLGTLNDKFYLSPKALPRLKYLHMALSGEELTKAFKDDDALVNYLKPFFKKYAEKFGKFGVFVGGERSLKDGKVYSRVPYGNFIMTEPPADFEREYEVDSAEYNKVVTDQKPFNQTPAPATTVTSFTTKSSGTNDDLPF